MGPVAEAAQPRPRFQAQRPVIFRAAALVVAIVALLFQRQLRDRAAARAEAGDSRRRADAVGTEVEIAVGPHRIHVREIEPARDPR